MTDQGMTAPVPPILEDVQEQQEEVLSEQEVVDRLAPALYGAMDIVSHEFVGMTPSVSSTEETVAEEKAKSKPKAKTKPKAKVEEVVVEENTVVLVRMKRDPSGPEPHEADVHPDEVTNWSQQGWVVA